MLSNDFNDDYIERSISAPPLSGYNSFEDFLPSALPSRNNPRIPKPIRTAHFDGETANSTEMSRHASFMDGFSSDILDDSHLGTIKSLVIDSKPKTPLDLIQADFPSTPSAVYSHDQQYESNDSKSPTHPVDETDELDDVLTGIDQTALAMQELLIAEDETLNVTANSSSIVSSTFTTQQTTSDLSVYSQPQIPASYQQHHLQQQQQQQQQHLSSFQGQFATQNNSYGVYNPQQTQMLASNMQMYPYPNTSGVYHPLNQNLTHTTVTAAAAQQMNVTLPLSQQHTAHTLATDTANSLTLTPQNSLYPQQTIPSPYGTPLQPAGSYLPVDLNNGVSLGMNGTTLDAATLQQQQQQQNGYYIGNPLVVPTPPHLYMDYYRMGMAQNPNFPQMNFPQQDMSYSQTTPDGMTYLAYPQQAMAGYWPQQPNQTNRVNDPTQQQNLVYNTLYGQQPTDFNGMSTLTPQMMVGMNMLGVNNGAIMTPHGLISGNGTLPLGYQQMNGNMTAVTNPANGQMYLHPGNNNRNPYAIPITSNLNNTNNNTNTNTNNHSKLDHQQDIMQSGNNSRDRRTNNNNNNNNSSNNNNNNSLGGINSNRNLTNNNGNNINNLNSPNSNNNNNNNNGSNSNNLNNNNNNLNNNNNNNGNGSMNGNNRSGSNNSHNGTTNTNTTRNLLVEDFRNTYGKGRQWEIKDLVGNVVAFCQDQHGSRFIQQKLEVANETEKQIVFNEVHPNAHSLMTDVFGNYVIQKLFEFGTPEQCESLASLLMGQAVQLALQMYGCRVIQKALEYVETPRLIALVGEFEGQQVLRCVHDQNGNHVIQKCIEVVSRVAKDSPADMNEYLSSRIQFIIQSFQGRVKELSMHPYGCRVVQRILEHCTNPQKAPVLEELRKCCRELIQDQYGNYVIQHVMQHGWETDRTILINEVQSKLLEYSQHKFASNVVEKCIQYADKQDRDEMIWTIINVTFDLNNPVDAKTGQCVLENMVRDPYANYVVQKVIDVSNETQRGAIIRYVRENIVQLRRYTYGKHIIVRLEKVSGEKF